MLVLQVLKWLLLAAELWIGIPILYLCVLSISAILSVKKRKAENTGASSKFEASSFNFAILIPAHNEEVMLGILLENLSTLEYPKDQYTVYVVADNCTDGTTELARATGRVQVYERFDEAKRGKGYALNWLLERLEENGLIYDAYVILDADSVVSPNFLQSMARELAKGADALQGCYTVMNASESPSTALRWIAMTLAGHVRALGRNGLDASCMLNGNGMCLSRSLLIRHPWQAYSLAEDYEYYLTLVEHGERVHYVPEAIVRAHMPTTFAQMRTQDIRWESSTGDRSAWQIALRLLGAGLRFGDPKRIEAIAELLTPPLSFLVSSWLLTFFASVLVQSSITSLLSLTLGGGLSLYIATGLYLLRPPRTVYKALLYAPGFMIWKVWVYLVLKRSKKYTSEWVRTSRPLPKDDLV